MIALAAFLIGVCVGIVGMLAAALCIGLRRAMQRTSPAPAPTRTDDVTVLSEADVLAILQSLEPDEPSDPGLETMH